MNICYIIRSFASRGGTENYVFNMSASLAKRGHQIHIVSLTGQGQWDFKNLEDKVSIHRLNLREHLFRGSWRLEALFPLYTWRYLSLINKVLPDLIQKFSIDIVEVPDWSFDTVYYMPDRKVPVCVRLHGYPGFKEDYDQKVLKKWPKKYLIWSLFRKNILNADLVTGVSTPYSDFVKKAWEIKEKDIKIIPIGIDLNVYHQKNVKRNDCTVLFAGRLEKSKGVKVLADAIPLILKEVPNTKFFLAGKDTECSETSGTWSEFFKNNFKNENITYLGAISTSNLIHHYQSATLCVMPSLFEPGGTVAFESMSCGCPLIAAKVGGLVEIIQDRQTGLLIPEGNARALADAVIALLKNPQLRQEIAINALAAIKKNYQLEKIVQQTVDQYSHTITSFKNKTGPSK